MPFTVTLTEDSFVDGTYHAASWSGSVDQETASALVAAGKATCPELAAAADSVQTFGSIEVEGDADVSGDLTVDGDIHADAIKSTDGANGMSGVATLVAGTKVVANTRIGANTRILLTVQSLGTVTAPKAIAVTARSNGVSFTITSADNTDTSVVAWTLIEPAA